MNSLNDDQSSQLQPQSHFMVGKKNPIKINKFIERFGGGTEASREDACNSQDFTNFFSARDNRSKMQANGQMSSARPKTTDRNAIAAKSFDALSPKTTADRTIQFGEEPNDQRSIDINVKRRYTAQRSRITQILSMNASKERSNEAG